jgi:two-component system chemotaxis sensor kinase CheA
MMHLHTLKGSAFTYQQPVLGEFVHDLEKFAIKAEALQSGWSDEARGILLDSLLFIRELVLAVREQRPANLKRLDLMRAMARFGSPKPPSRSAPPKPNGSDFLRKDGVSTRIPDDKLNQLEAQFQQVLQAKNRLGSFSRALSGEFQDESFPKELAQIHQQLSAASGELMGFFMELRAVPLGRIRDVFGRIIMETSERLRCEVDFDVEIEEHETISRETLDAIEMALLHTLRNAMDHGFHGRTTGNHLSFSVKRVGVRDFEARVRDNGAGVDRESLRKKVLETGIISEQALTKMPPERLLELAFIDGISTREEANEFSGRGLGLAAVKSGIERIGGRVSIWSEPGEGTEVVLRVPRWVSK